MRAPQPLGSVRWHFQNAGGNKKFKMTVLQNHMGCGLKSGALTLFFFCQYPHQLLHFNTLPAALKSLPGHCLSVSQLGGLSLALSSMGLVIHWLHGERTAFHHWSATHVKLQACYSSEEFKCIYRLNSSDPQHPRLLC